MGAIASQITSLTIVYPNVYLDADQRKHQSSMSLAFVGRIRRRPVNSPHKSPVTRKMFPFDDVIMIFESLPCWFTLLSHARSLETNTCLNSSLCLHWWHRSCCDDNIRWQQSWHYDNSQYSAYAWSVLWCKTYRQEMGWQWKHFSPILPCNFCNGALFTKWIDLNHSMDK